MKKALSLILALLMVVSMVGCSNGTTAEESTKQTQSTVSEPSAEESTETKQITTASTEKKDVSDQTYICCTYNSTEYYQRVIYAGFEKAGEMLGVKTQLVGDSGDDVTKYLTLLDNATAMNPNGIAVMCLDGDAYVDGINNAMDKGIPVFTISPDSVNSERISFMGLENESVGRFAGEIFVDACDAEGTILVLIRAGMKTCQDRLKGFEDYLAENAPNMKVETIQVSLDLADQTAKTSAALAANPDYAGVYCTLGWQAVAVSQACDELNYPQIPILGMDAELAQLELVKSGKIMGTLRQGNYNQGFWACLGLYLLANDYIDVNTFPETIDAGFYLVDQSNVDPEIEYYYEFNPEARP